MKKNFSKPTSETIAYTVIILLAIIFTLYTGPIYFPDSDGYLEMSIYRSCGYPIFIALHKLVFGSYFIPALLLTQLLLTISASIYFIKCIKKAIVLQKWLLFVLFCFLMAPVFYEQKIANSILSESIAYPLYLVIIGNIIIAAIDKNLKYFYYSALFTYVLILIRGQFLFLIPVILIGVLITYYKQLLKKQQLVLIACTILIPIIGVFTDIAFHKVKHNEAITTPWTGIQIVTLPFFVSDKEDYAIFETKEKQDYFKFVYAKLSEKKLLMEQVPEFNDKVDFYYNNYPSICNGTISGDGDSFFDKNLNDDQKLIANDKLTASMTIPLIKDNFKKWFKIYLGNISKGINSSKNLLIFLILLALSILALIKKESNGSKFIIIASLAMMGNIFLVALAEPVISRYAFYNNWILAAIVLFLFQNTFLKKQNE